MLPTATYDINAISVLLRWEKAILKLTGSTDLKEPKQS